METFPAVAEEVLREFQVLLQHSPPPIGSTRMLQLMAINMFAVYNSQPKGTTCCFWGTGLGISHSLGGGCAHVEKVGRTHQLKRGGEGEEWWLDTWGCWQV